MSLFRITSACFFLMVCKQAYAAPVYLQCTHKNVDNEIVVATVMVDETINKASYSGGGQTVTTDAIFTVDEVSFEADVNNPANIFLKQKYTINRQDLSITYDWAIIPGNTKYSNLGNSGANKGECVIKEVKERQF